MKNKITYENLYNEFKNIFPEYHDYFLNAEKENLVDETDGAHVSFAFCVIPLIYKFSDEEKKEELKKAFDYFEMMASSDDHLISEVVAFTILENICTDDHYHLLKPYFGKNTLDLLPLLHQYFDFE